MKWRQSWSVEGFEVDRRCCTWWKLFFISGSCGTQLAVDVVNNQVVIWPLYLSPTVFLDVASGVYITLNVAITSEYNTEHRASYISESSCWMSYKTRKNKWMLYWAFGPVSLSIRTLSGPWPCLSQQIQMLVGMKISNLLRLELVILGNKVIN